MADEEDEDDPHTHYHGTSNCESMLHHVPFFCDLDNYSLILICSKMKIQTFPMAKELNNEAQSLDDTIVMPVGDGNEDGTPPQSLQKWDHYVIQEGEYGNEMMVVVDGLCGVEAAGVKLGDLKPGDFFGENAILRVYSAKGHLRTRSVYAMRKITLAILHSDDLLQLRKLREPIDLQLRPFMRQAMAAHYGATLNFGGGGALRSRSPSASPAPMSKAGALLAAAKAGLPAPSSPSASPEPSPRSSRWTKLPRAMDSIEDEDGAEEDDDEANEAAAAGFSSAAEAEQASKTETRRNERLLSASGLSLVAATHMEDDDDAAAPPSPFNTLRPGERFYHAARVEAAEEVERIALERLNATSPSSPHAAGAGLTTVISVDAGLPESRRVELIAMVRAVVEEEMGGLDMRMQRVEALLEQLVVNHQQQQGGGGAGGAEEVKPPVPGGDNARP